MKQRRPDLKMMLIVAGITGAMAACVQLAAQFPAWAWAFTVFATIATPVANALKSAVPVSDESPEIEEKAP